MLPRITSARYAGNSSVWLRFNDGLEGTVDLSRDLAGEVFEPLRDMVYFARVNISRRQAVSRGWQCSIPKKLPRDNCRWRAPGRVGQSNRRDHSQLGPMPAHRLGPIADPAESGILCAAS